MIRFYSLIAAMSVILFSWQGAQAGGHPVTSSGTWQGAYAGVHVGTGEASYDGVFDSSEGDPLFQSFASDLDLDGAVGGVHAGYNWQTGAFVHGFETDITFADLSDTAIDRDGGATDGIEGEVDWLATIRGRAGIAAGNVLVFATGGLAFTNASYTANDGPQAAPTGSGTVDFGEDRYGYVVGGGVEVARGNRMSFRVEGLMYEFNDRRDAGTLNADSDPGDFAKYEDAWVVRAGINFKLGGGHSMAQSLK